MYSPFSHPDVVIARGSLVLTALWLASFASVSAATYSGVTSGEIQGYVVTPVTTAYDGFVQAIETQMEIDQARQAETAKARQQQSNTPQTQVESTVRVEVNTNGTTGTTQTRTQTQVTPAPQQNTYKSAAEIEAEYQKSVDEMNAKYDASVKAALDKQQQDFEQTKTENKAAFDARAAQMEADAKTQYDAAVQEMKNN